MAGLAARLQRQAQGEDQAEGDAGARAARPRLTAQVRPAEIPLSDAQRRLWFLDRLEGMSSPYVIPLAVRLVGRLERAALEGALCDLIERHESLRTVFPDRLGVPRQEIVAADVAKAQLRLAVQPADEGTLPGLIAQAMARGFDLSRELPLRAHLYALDARREDWRTGDRRTRAWRLTA